MRNLSDSDGLSPHTSWLALPDPPPSALPAPPQNIFSMLHLREVQAIKTRRQLQRHAVWLHRYELKSTLCGHQGCVNTIHWSKETNTLVSGSDDMTLKLWRVPPSAESEIKPILSLSTCHRHNIFDAHLRGQQILSCGADGFVCRTYLDRFDGRQERQGFESERLFRPNASNVPMAFKMDFLQSPSVFLVTFGDGYVRHFDLRCGTSSAAVKVGLGVGLVGLAVEPCDGQLLALGGNDPFLRIYDLRRLSFHQESNLRNMITTAVVSLHSTAEMIRKQKKVSSFSRFFSGHSDVCISGVCWDSCGRLLANYRGGDIELFDFRSALEDDPEATPSPDLSDSSSVSTSRVFLNSIRSYKGRINEQTCAKEVRFLCQGAAVASGGDCGHLYIWSTESTELLRKLPADRCVVNSVAPHPSLPLVATAGIEANIKAWDVDRSEDSEASQGGVVGEAQLAESRELEEEGHALMRQGAWVEATGCFEAALNRSSASLLGTERQRSCWMDMAFCHLNLEEYQAAIQCCSRALAGAPRGTAAAALLRRAAALVALGRSAEAAADLAAAEEVEPENVEIPKLRSKLKKLKKRQSKESKESKEPKSKAKSEG